MTMLFFLLSFVWGWVLSHLFLLITGAVLWAWAVSHQLVLYYIGSVLIEQLPPATPASNPFYRYSYSVIQILAANLRRSKDAVVSNGKH